MKLPNAAACRVHQLLRMIDDRPGREIGQPIRAVSQNTHSQSGATFRRRSEEHTSELQSLMRISYAVFCLKKKKQQYEPNSQKLYRIDNYTSYPPHTHPTPKHLIHTSPKYYYQK